MNIKNNKRTVLISFSVFLLLVIWGQRFSIAKYWYMKDFFKLSPEKKLKSLITDHLKDREILARYDLFSVSQGQKEAGPYLNNKITWEIGPHFHQGELSLPKSFVKEMNESDWMKKKILFQKSKINFKWLTEISKFDVWSLEVESPTFDQLIPDKNINIPYPSYSHLSAWQKLRYLHSKETKQSMNALKEVRQLMRLIWTNDNLVASMIVLKMLDVENEWGKTLDPKEVSNWSFVPHEHLKMAKRYLQRTIAGLDIRLGDETFKNYAQTSTLLCSGLFEAQKNYLYFKPFLEKELAHSYERLQEVIKSSGCRKNILQSLWEQKYDVTSDELSQIILLGMDASKSAGLARQDATTAVGYILGSRLWPLYEFRDE